MSRFGNNLNTFLDDSDYINSVSMSIMQIGELSAHLSNEFKVATVNVVQWNFTVGIRNHFAHGYSYMEEDEIFSTAINDAPVLKENCQKLIQQYF